MEELVCIRLGRDRVCKFLTSSPGDTAVAAMPAILGEVSIL